MSVAFTADVAGIDVVGLASLMQLTSGVPEVGVGLVDGPVVSGHPDLAGANLLFLGPFLGTCTSPGGKACEHATFLAGVLVGRRGSVAPALCPGCTLVVRPIFVKGLTVARFRSRHQPRSGGQLSTVSTREHG